MTVEYRMSQYMDPQTHRCRSCGGQFTPIKTPNTYASVAGVILIIVGSVFALTLVGIVIAIPLYLAAGGLFCIKKTVFKCHQCERVFDP
jgi:hypothetical protein